MEKDFAKKLVKDVLQHPFEKRRYVYLVREFLNHIEETPETTYRGNYIPDAYKEYVTTLDRIGKYVDPDGKKIDILIVHLKKETSLERARSMQRNFVAWFLKRRGEKDAALAAFVSPDEEDWRFSFVKMEYKFVETPRGHRPRQEFSPARRYSFLVGENENSHTAQRQLVPFLLDDDHYPKLNQLEEVFSIEKVTKEFFEKYRELFLKLKESLDELVKKDRQIKADFREKNVDTVDFCKKLLGQIVFLYFLQKKGWFGVKRGKPWGSGSKHFLRELFDQKQPSYQYNNFFNDILEPLFYEALRYDREGDYYSRFDCKIPFLNGGLFDPIDGYNWIDTEILFPNELFSNDFVTKEGDIGTGILDVFDRYNFTVKEDEPLEREVAVDPEMLGKVFENFLAVKDRKSKGTYYTPREIVHYMCQQSLINYFDTAVNTEKKPIVPEKPRQDKFFGGPEPQQMSLRTAIIPKEDITFLIQHGQSILEHDKRVETEGKETKRYPYRMPQSIRENAAAIDKALESIRICDPAVGSGAFLVGMMHEIINARSVLSTYLNGSKNRMPYDFKRDAIQDCLYGVDVEPGAVEIAKLRLWLSLIVDEEDIRHIKPLPNLDYKIVCGNSLVGVPRTLENWKLFADLEQLKPSYFDETNARKKQGYKERIGKLISQITNGHQEFDFQVYFSEVFHTKGGFDVVIANPPYLEARSPEFDEVLKTKAQEGLKMRWGLDSTYVTRGADLLVYFLELGIYLINSSGNTVFLTHNSWLDTDYGRKFQSFLQRNTNVKAIIDSDFKYFDSKNGPNINTVISVFRGKQASPDNIITFARFHEDFEKLPVGLIDATRTENSEYVDVHTFNYSDSTLSQIKWGILLSSKPEVVHLLNLLKAKGSLISEVPQHKLTIGQGLNLSKAFVINKEIVKDFSFLKESVIPFMTVTEGAPFELRDTDNYLIDATKIKNKAQLKLLTNAKIKSFDPRSTSKLRPILVLPRGVSKHFCAMNSVSAYSASGVEIYDEGHNVSEEIKLNLWLFLNSSVAWLLREVGGRKSLGGGLLKAEATDLRSFPIYFDFNSSSAIKDVYKSLRKRQAMDTVDEVETSEHKKIDKIVFDYLGLSKADRETIVKTLQETIRNRKAKSRT